MNTKQVGSVGEEMAVKYLKKHGYKILERNFTAPHGEIDIIAKEGKFVVFLEVKRRKSLKFGMPCEAVTSHKQQTIITCAKLWLSQNKLFGSPVRFDVVEVLDDQVSVIKNAFQA